MPLSDRPAAYSAMPIDFRKSAIVATTPSVPAPGLTRGAAEKSTSCSVSRYASALAGRRSSVLSLIA